MEISFSISAVALLLHMFSVSSVSANLHKYSLILKETNITRLCESRQTITANGMLPGPTIHVRNGDFLHVNVHNRGKYNATIHWHGVFQKGTPWADGPEYVTQCPILPGKMYTHRFRIKGQQGTLWWHAHSSWLRATVYGAFIMYPKRGVPYPFKTPDQEQVLLLGEWWNDDPIQVIDEALQIGDTPQISDALTINGQPGDLLPCSAQDTTRINVKKGETVLLRIINAALNVDMFLRIADHKMKVVAVDALYTEPLETDTLVLGPGQTTDVLVHTDKSCGSYYLAARAFVTTTGVDWDNTTTTAILHYSCGPSDGTPELPALPAFNDTETAEQFIASLRSLNSKEYPADVPQTVDEDLFITVSLGVTPCPNDSTCEGPLGQKLAASMNNFSFVFPSVSILQAYYYNIAGVYTPDLPDTPAVKFNYTDTNLTSSMWFTSKATKVKVIKFNSAVQIVFQGTGILGGESHPFHLHGMDFYVVGFGKGNYDSKKDPKMFNLVNPVKRNTVNVPLNGWTAIRFVADNPGAWILHCHLDMHLSIGMGTVLIVEGGPKLPPPPPDYPQC